MRNALHCYLIAAAALALLSAADSKADGPEIVEGTAHLVVATGVAPQLVYDWNTQRCATTDIPDAPPRAFRDFAGRIHLIATHENNRALIGFDFDALSHPCEVIYRGDHNDDPARFDDRQWLASFSTSDGRKVFALVHNEFHGNLRSALCPSGKYMSCWYNAITYAVSEDGGMTFHQPPPPTNIVAAPSVRYTPDAGRPIGYFQPSNIVRKDGNDYFLFLATKAGTQSRGICVARRKADAEPGDWLAWDGSGFNVRLSGAYVEPPPSVAPICTPVDAGGRLFEIGSLSYDRIAGVFIYVGGIVAGRGDETRSPGAYISTSTDLINWSHSLPLFASPSAGTGLDMNVSYGFFSLIDEGSGSMDYSEISSYNDLHLYYVKFDLDHAPYSRKLEKLKVVASPP